MSQTRERDEEDDTDDDRNEQKPARRAGSRGVGAMTRLALVLSGGVSLGTYVAGAALEILRAIEQDR